MRDLGDTSYLPLKAVFSGEAEEFTPWLSSNLDSLASELAQHEEIRCKQSRSAPMNLLCGLRSEVRAEQAGHTHLPANRSGQFWGELLWA